MLSYKSAHWADLRESVLSVADAQMLLISDRCSERKERLEEDDLYCHSKLLCGFFKELLLISRGLHILLQ